MGVSHHLFEKDFLFMFYRHISDSEGKEILEKTLKV